MVMAPSVCEALYILAFPNLNFLTIFSHDRNQNPFHVWLGRKTIGAQSLLDNHMSRNKISMKNASSKKKRI